MVRLPQPGNDANQWGALLNEFLRVAHREDGTLRGTSDVINIRDFGATPNESTPSIATANAVAIQNAIDAGYAVFIPASGIFYYDTTLTLRRDSILFGFGYNSALMFTGTGIAMQENSGSSNGSNLKLFNFRLTTNVNTSTIAIQLTNSYHATIEGISIQGTGGGFKEAGINIVGRDSRNSAAIRIDKCEILQVEGDGVLINGNTGVGGVYLTGNRIQGNSGWGFRSTTSMGSEITVAHNVIEGNSLGGFYADWLVAASIQNNHFETVNPGAIPIILGSSGTVSNTSFENNNISAVDVLYLFDANGGGGHNGLQISNNFFASNTSFIPSAMGQIPVTAIRIRTAFGVAIENNSLVNIPKLYEFPGIVFATVADGQQTLLVSGSDGNAGRAHLTIDGAFSVQGTTTLGGGTDISNFLYGSITFTSGDTASVSFSALPDAAYHVVVTGNVNEIFWVTGKATIGFVIHSSNPTSTATVDWTLMR